MAATTTYPETPMFGLPMQPIIDIVSSLSNILTAIERLKILRRAKRKELKFNPNQTAMELGGIKSDVLLIFNLVNLVGLGAFGIYGILSNLHKRKIETTFSEKL